MRTILENSDKYAREPMARSPELHFAAAVNYSGMMLAYNA